MKEEVYRVKLGTYRFGLFKQLSSDVLDQIVKSFDEPSPLKQAVLKGRGQISFAELDGVGSVVIKHYRRGGFLRHLCLNRYMRLGATRPEREFRFLRQLKDSGVRVPEPIGFVYEGSLLYKGWLITRMIEDEQSLAEISLADEKRARSLTGVLAQYIISMINQGICHVDLHAGNVLVDPQDQVFLIDFDKAYHYKGSKNQLRDQYLCRWRRAVIKHRLPEILSELLCSEVRRNYDGVK